MNVRDPEKTGAGAGMVVDDFKLIYGIGPGIESRLHRAGIRTYAQLAALMPEKILSVLGNLVGLKIERITKQDWIGQAKKLAETSDQRSGEPLSMDTIDSRMRYATFTVELLLDQDNHVRRTRSVHVQSEQEESWAGWDCNRLTDFIGERSEMALPQVEESIINAGSREIGD